MAGDICIKESPRVRVCVETDVNILDLSFFRRAKPPHVDVGESVLSYFSAKTANAAGPGEKTSNSRRSQNNAQSRKIAISNPSLSPLAMYSFNATLNCLMIPRIDGTIQSGIKNIFFFLIIYFFMQIFYERCLLKLTQRT